MQKLPIQQDNTTQSPAGTLAVCVNRQNLSEGTAGAGLLAVCAFSFQLVLWVVLLIAYLVPNLITSGFKPIHAASCACLLRVFWTVKGLQGAYPSQEDCKKKKKRINTSRVCLSPVSSTDYLRTIRLCSAFFGARFALTELQENAEHGNACCSRQPALHQQAHCQQAVVTLQTALWLPGQGRKAMSHPLKLYQHSYEGLLQAKVGFRTNIRGVCYSVCTAL